MSESARAFITWKLGWLHSLMAGVQGHREFRVAVCLLQFANRNSKAIFPAQARIAAELGCSERAVKRAIANLVTEGWLEARRPNRHLPNAYRFDESKRDASDALLAERLAVYRQGRWEGTDVSPQNDDLAEAEGTDVSRPEGADVSLLEGTDVSPKHIEEHKESNTAENSVVEAARGKKDLAPSTSLLNSRLLRRVA
jgi:hypothetical protein